MSGKKAPERKNIGKTRTFIITPKFSMDFTKEAKRRPMPEIANDNKIIIRIRFGRIDRCIVMPMTGASTSNMSACNDAMVVAAKALPIAMEVREMGATNISLRKPNSRSQTVEIVEKNATLITLMAIMPGYMNCIKSRPKLPFASVPWSPEPKMTRNIMGCIKVVKILPLSRQ